MTYKERRSRLTRAIAIVVSMTLVAGCSDVFDPNPEATPEPVGTLIAGASTEGKFTEIGVSSQLSTSNPSYLHEGALGAAGSLPYLVTAMRHDPDGTTGIAAFTSGDGSTWQESKVSQSTSTENDPKSTGGPKDQDAESGDTYRDIVMASDGTRTVIAASRVSAGHRRRLVAFESSDRTTWKDLAIPATANERGLVPQAVVVDGDKTIIFGVDGGYTPTALLLEEKGKLIQLPKSESGDEFGQFDGAALGDGTLVAVGRAQTPGDDPGPVSFRSTDGGLTWEGPEENFGTERGFISGIVFAKGKWYAAGAASSQNQWTPAVWSSTDGSSWSENSVADPYEERYLFSPQGDTFFSAPSAHGDTVAVATVNGSSRANGIFTLDGESSWTLRGGTEYWVARFVEANVAAGPNGIVLVRSARSILNIGVLNGKTWETGPTYGTERGSIKVDAVSSVFEGETSIIASEETIEYDGPDDPGWAVYDEPFLNVLADGKNLTPAEIVPPEAQKLESIITVVDPDSGAQLIAGSDFRSRQGGSDNADVFSWIRDSPNSAWSEGQSLLGPNTEMISRARRLTNEWVITGVDRDSAQYNSYGKAAVWTSINGTSWNREDGPFETDGEMKTAALDSCDLPGQKLLVVGRAQRGTTGWSPLAWIREADGTWSQLTSEKFGNASGELTSCATSDSGAVVQGTLAGRSMLWKTKDGNEFEQVRIGERGESYGNLISLNEGGYAAPGFINRGSSYGAVVWMSRDGENWFEVDVPSTGPLSVGQIADYGDSVVLAVGSPMGYKVWLLTNPYEILN